MGTRPKSKFTFVMISAVDRPVRSLRIPRPLLYWIPGTCALVVTGIILWQLSIHKDYQQEIVSLQQQMNQEALALQQEITDRESTIHILQDELFTLVEQANAVQRQLTEIQALELELREISGLTDAQEKDNPSHAAAVRSTSLSTGGEAQLGTSSQLQELAARIYSSMEDADAEMYTLSTKLLEAKSSLLEEIETRQRTPSIWPAISRKVTSGFGFRRDPFSGRSQHHDGIDIADHAGAAVMASAKGKVEDEGWDAQKGNYIIIAHGRALHTVYMHLLKVSVSKGQQVEKGEVIGQMGSTGRSTGPHLHYEVHVERKPVNPALFLK
jgi:murein DD-endopeptidase MepM/ murein hydrolase activator NlpD